MAVNVADVKAYVEAHKKDMVDFVEELVMIESGPDQKAGADRIQDILIERLEELGISLTHRYNYDQAGDLVVMDYRPDEVEDDSPIILSGHVDTVFRPGITSDHPFRLENGRMYGAGVSDMKAGIVMIYYIARYLVHAGYAGHPLRFIFVGDEETLHRYSNVYEDMKREIAGGRVFFNFEPSSSADKMSISAAGGSMIALKETGISAHSSLAGKEGASAILDLAQKIIDLEALTDVSRRKYINCGLIDGGTSSNTIPGWASAGLGIRFYDNETRDEIISDIKAVASRTYVEGTRTDVEIQAIMDAQEPIQASRDYFQKLREVNSSLGNPDLETEALAGVSDAALASSMGVAAINSTGVSGVGMHTEREEAELDSFYNRIVLFIVTILQETGV